MSENAVAVPSEVAAPETSAETQNTLPLNEPTPENSTPGNPSLIEKIKSAAGSVFERNGIAYKRGGGRPRKDGSPNKLDIPINAPATALPFTATDVPPRPAPGIDPVIVKRCCSAVFKSVQAFLDKIVFKKARTAGFEPKDAQQLVTDTAITGEEVDAFSELAEICLRKHGVGSQYAPEVGLAAILGGIGVRYGMAIQTLNEAIADKKASGK